MRRILFFTSLLCSLSLFSFSQEDKNGGKDPTLFSRMPGFYIYNYEELQFNKLEFWVSSAKKETVEGHYIFIDYYARENIEQPSGLQIVRNYSNAIRKAGGQVVYEYEDGGTQSSVMKIIKNGSEIWAEIDAAGNGMYKLYIIEKELMAQDVVADASSMGKMIRETGKVALYGIYFDTGMAVLKPESDNSLSEISKLMVSIPDLKLYVVGHTDNAGSYDSNMKLSMDRALAVVTALISKYGANASRLKACGDGPTAPVATNETDKGRALNRRVELVKQ